MVPESLIKFVYKKYVGDSGTYFRHFIDFKKGKEADSYSAYCQYNSTSKCSDVDHTDLPANR